MPRTPPSPRVPHPAPAAALALGAAVATILAALASYVFSRYPLLGTNFQPLHRRIVRAYRRFEKLLALAAAGRTPRIQAPRPNRPSGSKPIPFPRRRAWVIATLGHHAATYRAHLEQVLLQPETRATLAAAPAATRLAAIRALRPIAHMLGIDLPDILQQAGPPRPRWKPKPRAPKPPLPPLRPMPAYVWSAVRAWKPKYG